jgi:tRNA(Ile)-lysidine synthase TilS/MesJ
MGVDFRVEMTDIKNYLDFDGKNPCYMCGRLRKGVLRRISEEEGYNVIALGHHMDDAVETFFMNMIYTGKLGTFLPGAESDGIRMIRPMIYVREEDIIKSVDYLKLPIMESKCPVNKKTTREEMKVLVKELSEKYPDLREKVVSSFKNIDRLWNR